MPVLELLYIVDELELRDTTFKFQIIIVPIVEFLLSLEPISIPETVFRVDVDELLATTFKFEIVRVPIVELPEFEFDVPMAEN
jgi:hypothetical protein